MCEFQPLYYNDDGYVVCCKECGYYQLAFGSTMLTLLPEDFEIMCKMVRYKCSEEMPAAPVHTKCVVIPTPSQGIHMLLTRNEANRFNEILEEADSEAKAQCLIRMFNQ